MKMQKKVMSAAMMAALGAGSVQAVNLSTDGTGEVLIFPYYTVNEGHNTLISIVNTTDTYKAMKVRFREAMNSREVLDFNLYLSPYDVWVGAVTETDEGGAKINAYDNSCTVPPIPVDGQPFVDYAYARGSSTTATRTGDTYDGASEDISRTREGYFEVIEMGIGDPAVAGTWGVGVVENNQVWDRNDNGVNDAKHGATGVPDNCANINANWASGGAWAVNPADGMLPPTGGLTGVSAVIHPEKGSEISVVPTILAGWSDVLRHFDPGDTNPNFSHASPLESIVVMNDGPNEQARIYHDTWTNGQDAVSAVLMAASVQNEYAVNPNVEGETSWIVTFPTKWHYADTRDAFADLPFTDGFQPTYDTAGNVVREGGKACEAVDVVYYDREERMTTPTGAVFSPSIEDEDSLCYEVNVLNFNGSDMFGSEHVAKTMDLGFNSGWMNIEFQTSTDNNDHLLIANADAGFNNVYHGLPVIGFRASRVGNSSLGAGAAYDTAVPHFYERRITGTSDRSGNWLDTVNLDDDWADYDQDAGMGATSEN